MSSCNASLVSDRWCGHLKPGSLGTGGGGGVHMTGQGTPCHYVCHKLMRSEPGIKWANNRMSSPGGCHVNQVKQDQEK